MKKFLLKPTPKELLNKAWELSWYCGAFETLALNADEARAIAAGKFTIAIHPGGNLPLRTSPWLDPQIVTVEAVTA